MEWSAEGQNNVSPGWIGVTCCFCDDHSNHMGINVNSKNFSCWLCHEKGNIKELVMAIDSCDEEDAYAILRDYREDGLNNNNNPPALPPMAEVSQRNRPPTGSILPPQIINKWPTKHLSYLYKRGFKPVRKYIQKYKLLPVYTAGIYRMRIIIPIYNMGKLVNFTARDITGKTDLRYKHCPNNQAIIPRRELLYNIDNVPGDTIILVEGPTDVWKIGNGAVASMGTEVTDQQIDIIKERGFKNIFVLFDKGAAEVANRVAKRLAFLVDRVEIITLVDEDDPGCMCDQTTNAIRSLLIK